MNSLISLFRFVYADMFLKTGSLIGPHVIVNRVFQSNKSEISSLEIESFVFTPLETVEVSYSPL